MAATAPSAGGTNLPVAILITGVGGLLAYAGLFDPEGGTFGAVGRVLRGEPRKDKAGSTHVPGSINGVMGGLSGSIAAGIAAALNGSATAAAPASGSAGAGSSGASPAGAAVVAEARKYLGVPYLWGGTTPAGFDCSGLTQYVYARAAGIALPRVAAAQQLFGEQVAGLATAGPGDLLFYGAPAHHVAIYLGGSQQLSAPHRGTVVKIQNIDTKNLINIRRPVKK